MRLNKPLFCSRLVSKGEKEACFIVRLCDSVSLTQLDNYSRYQVLVNWTAPPLRAIYSNRIISSDFCQHSTITVLLILHTTDPSCHYTLFLTPLTSRFTGVQEKISRSSQWLNWWKMRCYDAVMLLGGKIGRNWWWCPHWTRLVPGPLLSSPLPAATPRQSVTTKSGPSSRQLELTKSHSSHQC